MNAASDNRVGWAIALAVLDVLIWVPVLLKLAGVLR